MALSNCYDNRVGCTSKFNCTNGCMNNWFCLQWWLQKSSQLCQWSHKWLISSAMMIANKQVQLHWWLHWQLILSAMMIATSKFDCNNGHTNNQFWLQRCLQMSMPLVTRHVSKPINGSAVRMRAMIDRHEKFYQWLFIHLQWRLQRMITWSITMMIAIGDQIFDCNEDHN